MEFPELVVEETSSARPLGNRPFPAPLSDLLVLPPPPPTPMLSNQSIPFELEGRVQPK